jgi:soluble lytic murein transglycosylase-like protein
MILAKLLCTALLAAGVGGSEARGRFACEHLPTVIKYSAAYDVDPVLMISLIHHESRWNPSVVSNSNACGLTQVLPKYSAGYRNRFGEKLTCEDLKDPTTSIERGTKILSYWIKQYARGDIAIALCGYNKGFRCKGKNPHPTGMRYAQMVMSTVRKIRREIIKIDRTD